VLSPVVLSPVVLSPLLLPPIARLWTAMTRVRHGGRRAALRRTSCVLKFHLEASASHHQLGRVEDGQEQ